MSPAVRNTLGRGRASSRSACGVLGARAAAWAQLPGEPRGRRRQDGDGSSCQAPAKSSELTGEEKSCCDLQTEQIGEETHRRQLHLER